VAPSRVWAGDGHQHHQMELKLSRDSRFQRARTACCCIFKVITLVRSNQGNYFENAIACSKCTLKRTIATQLKLRIVIHLQLLCLM